MNTSRVCVLAYEEFATSPTRIPVRLHPKAGCIHDRQTSRHKPERLHTCAASSQSRLRELLRAPATRGARHTQDGCGDARFPIHEQTLLHSSLRLVASEPDHSGPHE